MLNGEANGMPPLNASMDRRQWTDIFTQAFDRIQYQREADDDLVIDPYAAESPGEFFSVTSEYFFVAPHILNGSFPQVYQQLSIFYRQDPLSRY
jgi:Mlc titration factor MtfA (ptsG expression regulator)